MLWNSWLATHTSIKSRLELNVFRNLPIDTDLPEDTSRKVHQWLKKRYLDQSHGHLRDSPRAVRVQGVSICQWMTPIRRGTLWNIRMKVRSLENTDRYLQTTVIFTTQLAGAWSAKKCYVTSKELFMAYSSKRVISRDKCWDSIRSRAQTIGTALPALWSEELPWCL